MGRKRKQEVDNSRRKRAKIENEDSEDGEIHDSEDEWDEDLMGNDQDREDLMKLPELERERILFQRNLQRVERQERREAERKLRQEGITQELETELPTGIEGVSDDDSDSEEAPQ